MMRSLKQRKVKIQPLYQRTSPTTIYIEESSHRIPNIALHNMQVTQSHPRYCIKGRSGFILVTSVQKFDCSTFINLLLTVLNVCYGKFTVYRH